MKCRCPHRQSRVLLGCSGCLIGRNLTGISLLESSGGHHEIKYYLPDRHYRQMVDADGGAASQRRPEGHASHGRCLASASVIPPSKRTVRTACVQCAARTVDQDSSARLQYRSDLLTWPILEILPGHEPKCNIRPA